MEARAIQRMVRQSPRKMRLVIDLIRGRRVAEAYAVLAFSKKRAAVQIRKVLQSAVANAKQRAASGDGGLDEDRLRVRYAVVNEGPTLKRYRSAAQGRATPIKKRTSHVEIHVAADPAKAPAPAAKAAAGKGDKKPRARATARPKAKQRTKRAGKTKKKTATRKRSG